MKSWTPRNLASCQTTMTLAHTRDSGNEFMSCIDQMSNAGQSTSYQICGLLSAYVPVDRLVNSTSYDWGDYSRIIAGSSIIAFHPSNVEPWAPRNNAPYHSIMTSAHTRDSGNGFMSRIDQCPTRGNHQVTKFAVCSRSVSPLID